MKFPQFDFPTTVIIFGVTGDLSRKKLLPSLFDMYSKNYLPTAFRIVGFSRNKYSDDEFRSFVLDILQKKYPLRSKEDFNAFAELVRHQQGTFEDGDSYHRLADLLLDIDNTVGQCMNKLFYLAVPPVAYKTIFQNISTSELTIPCSNSVGWTRVLVEKPFGRDLETAQELDALLGSLFQEKQIFRIDHYLAKETLQDILTFRFSNTIFEPIWNNQWIEKVEIRLWEDIDIAARGAFYHDVGALRDVGQNHILQMLALIAMNHPGVIEADAIRSSRVEVMKNTHIDADTLQENVIRGQYKGFVDTEGVPDNSETETFFRLKAYIDNERWKGVPFYMESGKAMKDKKVEIVVTFKEAHPCFCPQSHNTHTHQNVITFSIQPMEKITVRFWSKRPGIVAEVIPQDLSFEYAMSVDEGMRTDAYEKVLFDCIAGDQTLFASTEEVSASWAFITPILKNWDKVPLETYDRGSSGPKRQL
jgi:glucose-6-phosphate 1-dehydrogenase